MSYLYTYDKGVPVLVTYILGEDHTVSASGTYLLLQDMSLDSKKEVEYMIETVFNKIPIKVTEILR